MSLIFSPQYTKEQLESPKDILDVDITAPLEADEANLSYPSPTIIVLDDHDNQGFRGIHVYDMEQGYSHKLIRYISRVASESKEGTRITVYAHNKHFEQEVKDAVHTAKLCWLHLKQPAHLIGYSSAFIL